MNRYQALQKAGEFDLDLLCVAPQAKPPVCKIINYGKYRFEQQKSKEKLRKIKTLSLQKKSNLLR